MPEPQVVQAPSTGTDLCGWASVNRAELDRHLDVHGSLLLRGFSVGGVEGFEAFAAAAASRLMPYVDRGAPRTAVRGHVYSATDFPPDYAIALHNEASFAATWPGRLFFHCIQPARSGGETLLADSRRVLARIDARALARFAAHGVLYVRNLGGPLGMSWEEVFQTNDRRELETFCHANGIAVEWTARGRLRTRQVRPAVVRHPRTGERVWFNHIVALHVSTLTPKLYEMLRKLVKDEADLPSNTYYGDGAPIEPEVLEDIRRAYEIEAARVAWRRGDVLMIDNMLVAHGRSPFDGPRQVVVVLAEPMNWRDLTESGGAPS
jgi:alpha-ketoglutarate-dependent taurine dioxygenase